jgi:hypothetical protein
MAQNSYDIEALIAQSEEWRVEAERATVPSRRAFCLSEAARCDRMVQRSIAIPVIEGAATLPDGDAGSATVAYRDDVFALEHGFLEAGGKPRYFWVKPSKAR